MRVFGLIIAVDIVGQYVQNRRGEEREREREGEERRDVSRQQKWHMLRHLVRGDLQVFSCMQENT